MDSSKKARCHGVFPRVRKRNSLSNKPASHGAHNGTQRHTSLLKNNKSLAVTLQETRCELSTYRNLFEESLEYMSRANLAKSKMMQLSTAFKDFIKAFDESLLLLKFDGSKWPNIKSSTQSCKNIPKGLNPVLEVANEMEEVIPTDQEMTCDEESSLEYSDQVFETIFNPPSELQKEDIQSTIDKEKLSDNTEMPKKLPEKKTKKHTQSNSDSQIKNVKGTKTKAKVLKFSPKKCGNSNYLKKMLSSSLSSQATKISKIPRCQGSGVQKQNILKGSESQNKDCKLKSPEKKCEELNPDFSRRKTFVIKSSNVLENFDSTENTKEKNNSESVMDEASNVSEGMAISKINKRKTFVKKNTNILKESTPEHKLILNNDRKKTCIIKSGDGLKGIELPANLNKMVVETEVVTENKIILSEQTDTENDVFISKDNRKTFVKKNSNKTALHQDKDVPEYQTSFPNKEYTSVNSELVSAVTENDEIFKKFSELQLNMNGSESDHAAAENKSIFAERFKPTVEDALLNIKSQAPSNEIKKDKNVTANQSNAKEKIEKTCKNSKSITDSDITNHNFTETIYDDLLNRAAIFSDDSLRKENVTNKLLKSCPSKSYNSFELTDSESEMLFIDEISIKRSSAFKSTPIRRQISKNKKKNFVFGIKKRKSILKRNSFCENNSNAGSTNENDVNASKVKNVHFISDDLVNTDNLQSVSCTVRKKTSVKKITDNQSTSRKSTTEKKANKPQTIKKKNNKAKGNEMDEWIPKSKKIKKQNVKKKKNEDAYFDDNFISKFRENDEFTTSKITETDGTRKELESDLPCKKTGKNTFLVHAEIHPAPPSLNMHNNMVLNKKNEKLNLQNMQVTVVLDDVLKSKNIDFLNISDRDLLSTKTVLKTPFSANLSYASIDPDESIEKLRSDPALETDDLDLHTDVLLNNNNNCVLLSSELSHPVLDAENPRPRRRKEVNYKEPSIHRKMRRC